MGVQLASRRVSNCVFANARALVGRTLVSRALVSARLAPLRRGRKRSKRTCSS